MNNLRITAGLLLLVQVFHLASLQESTDSPGRTIDKSWLRGNNGVPSQNTAPSEPEQGSDQGDENAEANNGEGSGVASGSMAAFNEEELNVSVRHDGFEDVNVTTTTVPPVFENATTKQAGLPNATDAPTTTTTPSTATTVASNSSQSNVTGTEEHFNSTMTHHNSTSLPDFSNRTDIQSTTSAPESNTTQEPSTTPDGDKRLTDTTTATTTAAPEINEASTTSSSTTVFPTETTETSTATTTTTTAAPPNTPEKANNTKKDSGSGTGSSLERGLASDSQTSRNHGAWGAVLGTMVAVLCVGLVVYLILKKKQQKGFSHRKLVEEYPSDPVLRLDNNEPMDLNYGGSAYYNPGLQGDSIQMSSFPGRH